MKVALCLSGQVRTYRCCYPSLYENVIAPLKADVFIHTWSNADNSGDISTDLQAVSDLYKPKDFSCESYDACTDKFAPPRDYEGWGRHTIGGKPMFYSIHKAHSFAMAGDYDVFVRCRFDLRFTKPLTIPEDLAPDEVYVPEVYEGGVNDMLAYGRREAMHSYTQCFWFMDYHCETGAATCNECLLSHHLLKMGLKVKTGCLQLGDGFELVRRCE